MRAGMPGEFIQELRGDVRREAIDIYYHVDMEELRRSYPICARNEILKKTKAYANSKPSWPLFCGRF